MSTKCFTRRHVEPELRHYGRTALGDLITTETFPSRSGQIRLLLWVGRSVIITATFQNPESALSYAKAKAAVLRKARTIQISLAREEEHNITKVKTPRRKKATTGQLPMFAEAVAS